MAESVRWSQFPKIRARYSLNTFMFRSACGSWEGAGRNNEGRRGSRGKDGCIHYSNESSIQ